MTPFLKAMWKTSSSQPVTTTALQRITLQPLRGITWQLLKRLTKVTTPPLTAMLTWLIGSSSTARSTLKLR